MKNNDDNKMQQDIKIFEKKIESTQEILATVI